MKCPSCGGNEIKFNIQSQSLHCEHCGQYYSVEQYKGNTSAELAQNAFKVNIFVCPDCGAELTSLDEEITANCSYCGGQVVLKEKQLFQRPKYIVPFKKTPEEASQVYQEYIKRKWCVPSYMKTTDHSDKFTGIYIPFWSYDLRLLNTTQTLKMSRTISSDSDPNQKTIERFEVDVKFDNNITDIVFDASEAFSDSAACEISPYYTKSAEDFHEGYLAGFVADRETISPKKYEENAYKNADKQLNHCIQEISQDPRFLNCNISPVKGPKQITAGLAMLPVWFMTSRHKDRVSYAIINGQTGKVTADVPVDKKKFFGMVAGIATILFIIAYFTIANLPNRMLLLFASMCIPMSTAILLNIMSEVHYKTTNNLIKVSPLSTIGAIFSLIMMAPPMFIALRLVTEEVDRSLGFGFMMCMIIIHTVQSIASLFIAKIIQNFPQQIAKLPIFITPLITFLAFLIIAFNPISEVLWYIGFFICIAGVLLNCILAISYFNDLASRPVPNFFNRGNRI